MQIVITNKSEDNIDFFVYNYLKNYIIKLFLKIVDRKRLEVFDEYFGIDSFQVLHTAVIGLLVMKNGNNKYIIKINKTTKLFDNYIDVWINAITYGNREIKGYTILLDLFNTISDSIADIYKRWLNGG